MAKEKKKKKRVEDTSIPLRPAGFTGCWLYGGKKCDCGPCDCTGYDEDDY